MRVSDFESPETVFKLRKKINWVWLDCFKNFNISIAKIKKLANLRYKICIVSPTLHNRRISKNDKKFFKKLKKKNIKIHMICEKIEKFSQWEKL